MLTAFRPRLPFHSAATVATVLLLAPLTTGAPAEPAAQGRGRIEGQVRLLLPAASAVPSGVYPTRRVTRPTARLPEISNVVVFLRDAPRQADLPAQSATIVQKDETFVPRVVAITRGSIVDFPNADPFFHNVFSLTRGATFDLGRYPKGVTRSRRFTTPALVKAYCHIHSHMSASIFVFDHPYFRMPDLDGSFAIADVPAGTYEIVAWHERAGESVASIRVEPGRTTRSEFTLPVSP